MKKYVKIIREYPLAVFMCLLADIYFTAKYTAVAAQCDPTPITYFIALYGSIMAILLFSAGWIRAVNSANKKEAEQRRNRRRKEINAIYSREFYSITDKM